MFRDEWISLIDDAAVVAAISEAESRTSGEIRVFVSSWPAIDPVDAARRHFANLKMTATRQRNAVLIFIAPVSQTFAIYGDEGIHSRLGQTPWTQIADKLANAFRAGRWTQGLTAAIAELGTLLAAHFPADPTDNPNELPDAIERDR